MNRQISESDWKVFRKIRVAALDRFCQRVLDEVSRLAADTGRSSHHRYLAVFDLVQQRDKELANTFDDARRSTALLQLAQMRSQELLTDEEFALFSSDTRALIEGLLGMCEA